MLASIFFGIKGKYMPPAARHVSISMLRDGQLAGRYAVLVVTTLEKLLLGARPAGGTATGGRLKLLAVDHSAAAMLRMMAMSALGRFGRQRMEGIRLKHGDEIRIEGENSSVILDGEIFHAGQGTADRPYLDSARPIPASGGVSGSAVASLVGAELASPVDPRVAEMAAAIAAQHGAASRAVLFYGSCLRERNLDGLMLDFYLIVSDYHAAYGQRWLATANRLIPPNVFPFALETSTQNMRFYPKRILRGCAGTERTMFQYGRGSPSRRGLSGRRMRRRGQAWFARWRRLAQPCCPSRCQG